MRTTLEEFAAMRDLISGVLVATSGGFDPLHVGHLRCLRAARELGDALLVIVNGDGYLTGKKGYALMSAEDRAEIIDSVRWVDYVFCYDDGSPLVAGAIRRVRPNVFAKGISLPDPRALPEWSACQEVGCRVLLEVGGPKVRSSSAVLSALRPPRAPPGPQANAR
jgi:D-beta-D-heptose 7-phosphate kinase/D-beta-D-heptose 1-phosphate adenosyltransferase